MTIKNILYSNARDKSQIIIELELMSPPLCENTQKTFDSNETLLFYWDYDFQENRYH